MGASLLCGIDSGSHLSFGEMLSPEGIPDQHFGHITRLFLYCLAAKQILQWFALGYLSCLANAD